MASVAALATACAGNVAQDEEIIDKPAFTSADGVFTIDALEALGRVGDPRLSPDGSKILYSVSYESVEHNRSNADLYVMNADGSDNVRITRTARSEGNAVWTDGGKTIAFLYPDSEGNRRYG